MQFSWCSSLACACSSGLLCVEASPPQYLGFWPPSLDAHLHVHGVLGSRRRSSRAGSRPRDPGFLASDASRARTGCTGRGTLPSSGGGGGGGLISPPQASHESECSSEMCGLALAIPHRLALCVRQSQRAKAWPHSTPTGTGCCGKKTSSPGPCNIEMSTQRRDSCGAPC